MLYKIGVEEMKKEKEFRNKLGLLSFLLSAATAVGGATVETNNTLYYSSVSTGDDVKVTTTDPQSLAPLKGFGVYMNKDHTLLIMLKYLHPALSQMRSEPTEAATTFIQKT